MSREVNSASEGALLGTRVDLADAAGTGRADHQREVGEAHGLLFFSPFFSSSSSASFFWGVWGVTKLEVWVWRDPFFYSRGTTAGTSQSLVDLKWACVNPRVWD